MIDGRNINIIRNLVRKIRAEMGANTEAVTELNTLIGATPLETGKTVTSELADHESRIDTLEITPGGINYSESEQATSLKWIDGKDIYQKTLVVDNPQNEGEVDVGANIGTIVRLFGTFVDNDNTGLDISTYLSSSYHVGLQYLPTTNKLNFQIAYTGGLSKAYITIQYTKSEVV